MHAVGTKKGARRSSRDNTEVPERGTIMVGALVQVS